MRRRLTHAARRFSNHIPVLLLLFVAASASEPASVQVQPSASVGPRQLEKATEKSVVRDYLKSWQTLAAAMESNNPDLLDAYFVGVAREKLANTVREQRKLGIDTRYHDHAHDIQITFYSPEGLSLQLVDTVDYDVQVIDHGNTQPAQQLRARYVAVLTPTEMKWKVRIFQAEPLR